MTRRQLGEDVVRRPCHGPIDGGARKRQVNRVRLVATLDAVDGVVDGCVPEIVPPGDRESCQPSFAKALERRALMAAWERSG
jgi:hypothetical protein